jgi:hypothetical protein
MRNSFEICVKSEEIKPVFKTYINPSQTKLRLVYLKKQSVPRCKHFLSRL